MSILIPHEPTRQKREIRVRGQRATFQELIDILGEVEGQKYETTYLTVDEALAEQERARKAENEDEELAWSLRTLGASGFAIVPDPLDTSRFDFTPETVRETFKRVFQKHI